MSAIIVNDKIVHYEVLGRGKPIIFLHGWAGSWRYWIPAMQSISTDYRAYALDLWGFGDTAKEPENYSLEKQTALLDYFLNHMGIGKVALVGHGLGAVISFLYAAKHAQVVDRIMGISMPLGNTDGLKALNGITAPELVNLLVNYSPSTVPASSETPKTDQLAIQTSLNDLKEVSLLEILKKLRTSSLLINGHNDPLYKPSLAGKNGELPMTFHQIVFNQSGHFPMLDQPNKFNRLMKDFFELETGASPKRLQIKEEWRRRVR
ncbi:MAG: alpha/beta hydrolase [Anaerolineae bacterium]|nr:alpha/beta hydrolase [Anaerolineae bacterium]